ncbi:hypothetical protein PG985_011858 [Apiospora marii]|uniref:uncharacterized protein n=1 Tax=Apiospora marii TaxID=335849 RepID=UPI0031318378
MPTATEYFGYAAVNYGPLTTTFTADRSCATPTDNLWIYDEANSRKPMIANVADCATATSTATNTACYPNDSKVHSLWSEIPHLENGIGVASYFSPGVACPSGWTTVGTMARATPAPGPAGEPVAWNSTGSMAGDIFEVANQPNYFGLPPLLEIYRQIMAPEETLAFCCPSGYQNKRDGNCFSSVTPLTALKGWNGDLCWGGTYHDYHAEPVTTVMSSSITTQFWSPVTSVEPRTTFTSHGTVPMTKVYQPSQIDNMVVVKVVGVIPLIHRASDLPNAAAASLTPAAGGALAVLPLAAVVLSMFVGARMISR